MPIYLIVDTSASESDSSLELLDSDISVEWVEDESSVGWLRAPDACDVPATILASPLLQPMPPSAVASSGKKNRGKKKQPVEEIQPRRSQTRQNTDVERLSKRLGAVKVMLCEGQLASH